MKTTTTHNMAHMGDQPKDHRHRRIDHVQQYILLCNAPVTPRPGITVVVTPQPARSHPRFCTPNLSSGSSTDADDGWCLNSFKDRDMRGLYEKQTPQKIGRPPRRESGGAVVRAAPGQGSRPQGVGEIFGIPISTKSPTLNPDVVEQRGSSHPTTREPSALMERRGSFVLQQSFQ